MFLDNVIFHFYKGVGGHPLTGPPNLNGFSSIIWGGGGKSLLTNVNKKMVFFNEGFPNVFGALSFVAISCTQKPCQERYLILYFSLFVSCKRGMA